MTDIVERLKAGTGGGKHWMDLRAEAAAEIERLRAAVLGWREVAETNLRTAEKAVALLGLTPKV